VRRDPSVVCLKRTKRYTIKMKTYFLKPALCACGLAAATMTALAVPLQRADVAAEPFRRRYLLVAPYLLFAGRIEKGKGLEAVFEYYRALKYEGYVELVLIGKKLMDVPAIQGVKYLGYVSEADKLAAFKGALFSLQPSPLESLSITTLESFSTATPVLVNRRCAALLEHVDMSGGGLAYDDQEEFLAAFRRLYRRPALRAAMGAKGLAYVKKYFSWDAVLAEIRQGIAEILGKDVRR